MVSDSFWFLPDDDPESDAERPERSGVPFDSRDAFEPFHEPMKGNRSRPQRAPSTDQKRVRRQIHRSGQHTASGYSRVNWDVEYPRIHQHAEDGELHRGLGLDLPDDLHQYVHDESQPVHERARALLDHIAGEDSREYAEDYGRLGLGMHWSMHRDTAQRFAHENGPQYAATNFHIHNADDDNLHDFTYGTREGDVDADKLAEHLRTEHRMPYHEQDQVVHWPERRGEELSSVHRNLHRVPMSGQGELFPISREHYAPGVQDPHIDRVQEMRGPDVGRARPATEIVLSTPVPPRHLVDESPETNPNSGGEVYHPFQSTEREVPLRQGAQIPITQISWSQVRHGPDAEGERSHWTHHRFGQPEQREAAKKDAAYGEGAQQPVIPTHKLPSIPEGHARTRNFLQELLEGAGLPQEPDPGGFDEPFQRDRFVQRRDFVDKAQQDRQQPQQEPRAFGWTGRELADTLGPPDTVRRPQDAYNPEHGPQHRMFQNFKDRWDKTFEPVGLSEEGKARSRRQTRARWSKVVGPPACDHPNCPPWQHQEGGYRPKYSAKTATVLNTQIERLNQGDQIRTPTGQTSQVKGLRPHETDSTKLYLDTDMGTSLVDRGTNFQVVPKNSQQQELPDTGNPMASGNTATLPGSGRTPSGQGVTPQVAPGACPNCGNLGTLHLHGGDYVCSVCGFTVPAGGSPGGLTFTNQPSGAMPAHRRPGPAPRAHVWASKYSTFDQESQIARRARQVSGGDQ